MLTKVNNLSITGYEEEHLKFGTYSSYSYDYYADGNIKTVTDNKGEVTNYIYDGAGRLIAERYDNASGENSYANLYRYDARGNRTNKEYRTGSREEIDTFVATINPYSVMLMSWEEELFDTWQSQTENASYISTYYIYDNNNRLTSQNSNYVYEWINDKREYTYDKNGNLIHKYAEVYYDDSAPEDPTMIECSKDNFEYEYNDLYQLIGVEKTNIDDNEIITEYAYDAAGQRISKTVDGDTTYHIWDNQSNIIGEYGANTATYYRGLNGEIITDGVSHYAYNGHGDTTSLTQQVDNSLVFAETYQYDAFGNQTDSTADEIYNPFRYCGEYFDEESGLIYLRARYYDSSIGAFINEDPIRDGLNWYVYCNGNPVMFVDPTGYITQEEMDMMESGQMAPAAYTYLMELTYEWYLADTQEYKDYLNKLAEDFRENDYKTTNGFRPDVDKNIELMKQKPTVDMTMEMHYFRNELNLEYTWEEMQKLQKRLPENLQWDDGVLANEHQNHTVNGEKNIKYVSACGHFEVIYNANHEVQNQYNNTDDMGTYNYISPLSNWIGHGFYDVAPYYAHGNVPDSEKVVPQ